MCQKLQTNSYLLNIFIYKTLERLMTNHRLVNFLVKYNVLSSSQQGFPSGKCTSDAVHELSNYVVPKHGWWAKSFGLVLDIKAFDTVSAPILIRSWNASGIRGTQLKLFEDCLKECSQRVRVDILSVVNKKSLTVFL